ncbi:hypothetical protein [Pseudoalteromonas luteoviolacea]|uniref:hypothetical protein n=1 Tax=Pseudoalteromonas luteoviolacea TaxID=43657 RepID=UPI001B361A8A|nr:hypothetical protein [Pseudoalteromonas luteoviolacea]MBQ4836792.1 hypothetical protein [Pseudoalteromonas luteoviolacea]
MKLDLINVFEQPYEFCKYTELSSEEMDRYFEEHNEIKTVRKEFLYEIKTHFDAAKHIADKLCDSHLESHIDRHLQSDSKFKKLLNKMPKLTEQIKLHKTGYNSCNESQLIKEMSSLCYSLSDGQVLFHGGHLLKNGQEEVILDRPLSTSFCPQIALRNAQWRNKAGEAGVLELYILTLRDSNTNVFVFDPNNQDDEKRHEKEVLFQRGLSLKLKSRIKVKDHEFSMPGKKIRYPINLVELEAS